MTDMEKLQAENEQLRRLLARRTAESYWSVAKLAALLDFSDATVRTWVKAGRFSPNGDLTNVLSIDGDIRVPASGVAFFCANHEFRYDAEIKARNTAELRRKLAA